MRVLGIESSCDETAAAVVDDGPTLLANVVHTQVDVHAPFGGVVPEVASREHMVHLVKVIEQCVAQTGGLKTVDAIAVTQGPGLLGALLVGLQMAKGLALALDVPWVGVNHLEGHLAAADLCAERPPGPHVALVVSGGHTHLYHVQTPRDFRLLGATRDDAAGEAFDKVAKVLGLGYPGGPALERAAQGGDPKAVALPRAWLGPSPARGPDACSLSFSFSGLKTAAQDYLHAQPSALTGAALADFCASLQEAIVDVLTAKAVAAALQTGAPGIVLAGGVAANNRLRTVLDARARAHGLYSFAPPKVLCTDNAAMIAAAGWARLQAGEKSAWGASAKARWPLGQAVRL
jgi:N6-L-threonylcarbamoyladenine synthase